MRLHHLFRASFLVPLLAACGDSAPPVVLVHASDPHLLDGKRPEQEVLNLNAFSDMMDVVADGAGDGPPPRYLVITGDFGIEDTDPRVTPGNAILPPDSTPADGRITLAAQRRDELVNLVASEIQGSTFDRVYFVPGNNDVFLEDARPSEWSGIGTFVAAVQSKLSDKEFVDLTACYRKPRVVLNECYARIDPPYVLVGFPSLSFKNTELEPAQAQQLVPGGQPGNPPDALTTRSRVHQQDSVHRELLRRFRQVLSEATAGGWRALVVTHIPDLDDPYSVSQQVSHGILPKGLRLADSAGLDAWNASPAVFAEWKALVESPRVAGVLAGHFHAADRRIYYRPYRWSASRNRADRRKIFVAPPLAIKNQEKVHPGARGFSVLTLAGDSVRRQLQWYNARSRSFSPDSIESQADQDSVRQDVRSQDVNLNPAQDGPHSLAFLIALLSAAATAVLWRTPQSEQSATGDSRLPSRGTLSRVVRAASEAVAQRQARRLVMLRRLLPESAGGIALVIMDILWDQGWSFWLYATFWTIGLLALLLLLRIVVVPRFFPRRHATVLSAGQPGPARHVPRSETELQGGAVPEVPERAVREGEITERTLT